LSQVTGKGFLQSVLQHVTLIAPPGP